MEYGYESTHHELQTCLDFTADVCPSINSFNPVVAAAGFYATCK
ncbi:hypothetical protein VCHC61A1_0922 [Vibrio cholerae HC-61A1]|nr:hypothetical protein VCHC61A1_0922 [Vibrio cholerae HC-61A1]